ncbi:hypothetical protein PS6_008997 [Mucor atramentarius]
MAFTPNVKTIDGDFDDPFYSFLLRTAQHATGDFKLESLLPPFAWKNIHLETFLCFKESLKYLELNFNSNLKDEFISLTTISLTISDTTTLKELEALLSKCPQLEKLDLDFGSKGVPMMEKTELDEWMMSQVKKDTSLKTLALDGSINPSIVKYLLQKYPNVTSVEIASMESYSVSLNSSSLPILDAIKGLNYSSVGEWVVDTLQPMKAFVPAMES